jgi:hypothetical protein
MWRVFFIVYIPLIICYKHATAMGKEGEPPYTPPEATGHEEHLPGEKDKPYFSLESTAKRLGLEERMNNPEVRENE